MSNICQYDGMMLQCSGGLFDSLSRSHVNVVWFLALCLLTSLYSFQPFWKFTLPLALRWNTVQPPPLVTISQKTCQKHMIHLSLTLLHLRCSSFCMSQPRYITLIPHTCERTHPTPWLAQSCLRWKCGRLHWCCDQIYRPRHSLGNAARLMWSLWRKNIMTLRFRIWFEGKKDNNPRKGHCGIAVNSRWYTLKMLG